MIHAVDRVSTFVCDRSVIYLAYLVINDNHPLHSLDSNLTALERALILAAYSTSVVVFVKTLLGCSNFCQIICHFSFYWTVLSYSIRSTSFASIVAFCPKTVLVCLKNGVFCIQLICSFFNNIRNWLSVNLENLLCSFFFQKIALIANFSNVN